MHRLLGGHIISAAIQTNRKNCSVNDAGGREEPTYSSERLSRHTVVSDWGYGEAGLLKLTKTNSFAWHGILL